MPSAAVDRDEERCFRDGSVATVLSMINDRRDDMTLAELVEELELSYPEKVASFERRYPDAMAAVVDDDLGACDPEELDDLASDLRRLLRV
jgi:methionine synthase I (cobalamin-dependent)